MNNTGKRYPSEVQERAVRMVLEHEDEYDSQWAAISSVSEKLGMTPRRSGAGCARRRSTAVCAPASPPSASGCANSRGRTGAQAGQRDPESSRGFLRSGVRPPTEEMTAFIAEHKEKFGVEPMCAVSAHRPFHLLRRHHPAPLGPRSFATRSSETRDHPRLRGKLLRLRPPQGVAATGRERASPWPAARWSASCAPWA